MAESGPSTSFPCLATSIAAAGCRKPGALGEARVITLARHREFRWQAASKVELTASAQALFDTLLSQCMRGVVVAGEPQAMAAVPRAAIDLLVSLGRRGGSFIVVAMEDAPGAQIFVHGRDGGFHRRTTTPSFAATVRERGHGEALSSALR